METIQVYLLFNANENETKISYPLGMWIGTTMDSYFDNKNENSKTCTLSPYPIVVPKCNFTCSLYYILLYNHLFL